MLSLLKLTVNKGPSRPSIYKVHPLRFDDSTNIRLIRVLSSSSSNLAVSCVMQVVSLEDAPPFTALSYVWGHPKDAYTIQLNGAPFTVRKNLWTFLNQYRQHGYENNLWIDALCIDQESVSERNHQVAMMVQIYTRAALVVAWIGTEVGQELQTISSNLAALKDWASASISLRITIGDSLYEVFRNEYWRRLWILQELVLGNDVELWSGSGKLDSTALNVLVGLVAPAGAERDDAIDWIYVHLDALTRDIMTCRKAYHTKPRSPEISHWFSTSGRQSDLATVE